MLRSLIVGLTLLTMAPPAWGQAAVTAADITRLETTAGDIEFRAAELRKSDPVLATSVEKSLGDLRDDIAYLKVKLRRDGAITRTEYVDLRDRLDALRVRAQSAAGVPARATATPAPSGRSWTDKGFINVSLGVPFGTQTVAANFAFPLYDETATVSTTRDVKGGALFDVTGGVRLGSNWGVGLNFYKRSVTSDGTVAASIPDPLAFDSPRAVTSTIPEMVHRETWIAPLFVYVLPLSEKLDVMLMVGPALAKLEHDLATSATVTEASSGPQIAIAVTPVKHSYITFELGGDVRYALTKNIGVGGFVRFGHTAAHLSSTIKLTLGGVQAGGGLRIRF